MSESDRIPLMFRAQIEGRSQIQRLIPKQARQQADDWVDQWLAGTTDEMPKFGSDVRTRDYQIVWRIVSNGGQDDGAIRPVLGAGGSPYYPGSSMKGAFRRACETAEDVRRYCGGTNREQDTKPGMLRFHGAYPKNDDWKKQSLVDLVHPQEDWQVKESAKHSAFIQISLYRPTLIFGISSNEELDEAEWEKIWGIWTRAMERGIGCRTSAGYGHQRGHGEYRLMSVGLTGQGQLPQLLNKSGEFRPNMFKAALRGHTMRLFGGVTDAETAAVLTRELWGGFAGRNGSVVGELALAFDYFPSDLAIEEYRYRSSTFYPYELTEGTLNLLCTRQLSEKQRKNLRVFIIQLVKFALLLGGFGKSWRRVDHRIVMPSYLKNNSNPPIGCHWEFTEASKALYVPVENLDDIRVFLEKLQNTFVRGWVRQKGKQLSETPADWREAWHPDKVQVWGRIASGKSDSEAVRWFHGSYLGSKSIKKTLLTGWLGQIGRVWHRMYPQYIKTQNGRLRATGEYIELLTMFPDDSETTRNFLKFLESASSFSRLYLNVDRG